MQLGTVHFTCMGSPCELQLYCDTDQHRQALAEDAMAEARRLEQRYSLPAR